MIKLQTKNRKEIAESFLKELSTREENFTKSVFEKYGKSNLNPETGEIQKID